MHFIEFKIKKSQTIVSWDILKGQPLVIFEKDVFFKFQTWASNNVTLML
jgi:hypothetical protein